MRNSINLIQKFTATFAVLTLLAPSLILRAANDATNDAVVKPLSDVQRIMHVLNRLGFGARPGDVAKVKALGLAKYIDQQLSPELIDDSVVEAKVKDLDIFGMSTGDLFAKYPNPGALLRQLEGGRVAQAQKDAEAGKAAKNPLIAKDEDGPNKDEQRERRSKIQELYAKYDLKPATQILPQIVANRVLRSAYSERQLQEVMVDFWQNHFNVFSGKNSVRWYIPSYERDVLRRNALGNFKDLVVQTGQHPAMLFYLDNFESVSPNVNDPAKNTNPQLLARRLKAIQTDSQTANKRPTRGINENYARELMELHTLGVDGGYSQKDIVEVAKCFTGWTITDPRGYRRAAVATIQGTEEKRINRLQKQQGIPDELESGTFYFNPRWHETGPKTVLGQTINEGGVKDGLKVIDILVAQPTTAKFIARKLAVKFVSDSPSEALVGRVAAAFQKSKGDIKVTLKTLFNDKEFFAPENYRAKIKSPLELAVSSIRTLGATTNAGPALMAMLNKLGEIPYGYQAPTGYPDTAEDWVNTGALLERLNFAIAIASNRIPGTRVDLRAYPATDKIKILDRAIVEILDGEISPSTRTSLLKQLEQPLPEAKAGKDLEDPAMEVPNMRQAGQNRQARLLNPSGNPDVFKAVSLVLGTPEFQRQ